MPNYIFRDFLENQNNNLVQMLFEMVTFFSEYSKRKRKETSDFEEEERLG